MFCSNGNFTPLPATETNLCMFVSYLGESGLKHRTIKSYLSAIRFLHISEGLSDPFRAPLSRLHYVLRGVRRIESEKNTPCRECLPISPQLLLRIKSVWPGDKDHIMLWAACCLDFFGFLRAGEFTVLSDASYDNTVHLNVSDISVNNTASPTVVKVDIKRSKSDPFWNGISIFLGTTGSDLCPVTALMNYLVIRGKSPGPLFKFSDGHYLTRQRLVDALRKALV